MKHEKLLARIRTLIHASTGGRGIGILTTASGDWQPHATWMGTIASPALNRIVTMTSPDSRKAHNILENPSVEWMFTNRTMTELAYLRGKARILQNLDCIDRAWEQMPDKSRAYFLKQATIGMTFLIIETRVESIEYRIPRQEKIHFLNTAEITEAVVGED